MPYLVTIKYPTLVVCVIFFNFNTILLFANNFYFRIYNLTISIFDTASHICMFSTIKYSAS